MWASKANTTGDLLVTAKSILDRIQSDFFSLDYGIADSLKRLEGASVRFNIKKLGGPADTPVSLFTLRVENGRVIFFEKIEGTPDVTMTGSVFDFLALLGSQSRGEPLSAGKIELHGDLATAQEVQNVINNLDFDLDSWVAGKLGDDFAHLARKVVQSVTERTEMVYSKLERDWSEYLKYELQVVPRNQEVDEFRNDSFRLEEDLDRLDARIKNLNLTSRSS